MTEVPTQYVGIWEISALATMSASYLSIDTHLLHTTTNLKVLRVAPRGHIKSSGSSNEVRILQGIHVCGG